jgi:hypothetical protein
MVFYRALWLSSRKHDDRTRRIQSGN